MKRYLLFCLIVFLLFNFGCSKKQEQAIADTLWVTGDVNSELFISDYADFDVVELTVDGSKIRGIRMTDILKLVKPAGSSESVYFCSPDNVIAKIPYEQMSEVFVSYSKDEHWVCIAPLHPPQAAIKNMDKIVLKAGEIEGEERCIRILEGAKTQKTITYGGLFEQSAEQVLVKEGEAKKGEYSVTPFTLRSLVPILPGAQKTALAYFGDGSQQDIDLSGYFEWRGSFADYIKADGKSRIKDIIGIWTDAPVVCVTDIAGMVLNSLHRGRVLVIELDGVGYYLLQKAMEEGSVPFLSQKELIKARTVMPSVSSVALASILTGLLPSENGVFEEGIRELGEGVTDIFESAESMGKTSVMVEGNSVLVKTSIDQILNPDINKNASTDDEVFDSLKKVLDQGFDLTFAHFHGYDDIAHTYGPTSKQAQEKLTELDGYIKKISSSFSGTVIILADHGMHDITTEGKLGEHGSFFAEDLTVPIIIFKGAA